MLFKFKHIDSPPMQLVQINDVELGIEIPEMDMDQAIDYLRKGQMTPVQVASKPSCPSVIGLGTVPYQFAELIWYEPRMGAFQSLKIHKAYLETRLKLL